MTYILRIVMISMFLFACNKEKKQVITNEKTVAQVLVEESGNKINTRFKVPKNFKRVATKKNTFQNYLQNFELKPQNTKVHFYNGELKYRQDIHASILDISVGKSDLQQCADATMRLWAEFLYQQKDFEAIHFNFTNGFNVAYIKWRQGYRLKVIGNKVSWYKTNKASISYQSFQEYMRWIFMYAGTLSLAKEMKPIAIENMQIGDVFIQGGSPGHAVIVVDMAINKDKKVFMLAQSYMPAQDIHVLKNLNNTRISPWYATSDLTIQTPEWVFTSDDLKRFSNK